MKTSQTLSIIAATVLFSAGAAVYAQPGGMRDGGCRSESGMGPAMMEQGGPRHGRHEPGARMAVHLDRIQADLKLRPDQQPAWDALRASMTKQMEEMKGMRDALHADGKTLPERMAQREALMEQGMMRMKAMSEAMRNFYTQLTPEQQKIADTALAMRQGPRFGGR